MALEEAAAVRRPACCTRGLRILESIRSLEILARINNYKRDSLCFIRGPSQPL